MGCLFVGSFGVGESSAVLSWGGRGDLVTRFGVWSLCGGLGLEVLFWKVVRSTFNFRESEIIDHVVGLST